MDTRLSFQTHSDTTYNKALQRLHLLRKLRHFNVSRKILTMVYRSLIESILTFNIISWYNLLTSKQKTKLSRITAQASKIIGSPQTPLSHLYERSVITKAILITEEPSHPLHSSFTLLPSGRRYKVPSARKSIYKKSFIPSAVTALNSRRTPT